MQTAEAAPHPKHARKEVLVEEGLLVGVFVGQARLLQQGPALMLVPELPVPALTQFAAVPACSKSALDLKTCCAHNLHAILLEPLRCNAELAARMCKNSEIDSRVHSSLYRIADNANGQAYILCKPDLPVIKLEMPSPAWQQVQHSDCLQFKLKVVHLRRRLQAAQ